MNPALQQTVQAVIRESRMRPRRALEVGGVTGWRSLLRCPELEDAERYCLNLFEVRGVDGIIPVVGNANDMSVFEDESFDLVMSNATLEHDKHFWLSVAQMRRVLAPGGMLLIGAPGYIQNPHRDEGKATHTFRVHFHFDYYRFSEQAFRDVFFDGMDDIAIQSILHPPRILGVAFKPGGEATGVDRTAAAAALAAGPLTVRSVPPVARSRLRAVARRLRAAVRRA